MIKKLCAGVGLMLLTTSCGDDELESNSKFISKVQAGASSHLPFLIKKVGKNSGTLEVKVNVGTWWNVYKYSTTDKGTRHQCSPPLDAETKPPPNPVDRTPENPEIDRRRDVWTVEAPEPDNVQCRCVHNPRTVVRGAIAQWLAPLREAEGANVIISDSNIKFVTSGPDLTINFVCKESVGKTFTSGQTDNWEENGRYHEKLPTGSGCPTPSYSEGRSCTTFASPNSPPVISIGDFDEFRYTGPNDPKVHNAAFAGIASPPTRGRDKIPGDGIALSTVTPGDYNQGQRRQTGDEREGTPIYPQDDEELEKTAPFGSHDMLDLLHELGHAFGLADTHRAGAYGYPKHRQPLSIMSGNRTPTSGGPRLQLGYDDKRGIRWLYENKDFSGIPECPDDYPPSTVGKGCVPADTLLYALLTDDYQQALELLRDAQRVPTRDNLEINKKAALGNTALHLAIFRYTGREPDDPSAQTDSGNDDEEARRTAYLEIIRLILDDPNLTTNVANEKRADGDTPLHLAVRLDRPPYEAVELLLTSDKVTAAEEDARGDTALHIAARMGNHELIEILQPTFNTTAGAKNKKEENTPLHLAILGGQEQENFENFKEAIDTLLGRIDVAVANEHNRRGRTPLHLAAKGGSHLEPVVRRLLAMDGIEVNKPDKDLNTALHLAARFGTANTVSLLLNHVDINPKLENNLDHTPRDSAFHSSNEQREQILQAFDGTYYGEGQAERNLLLMIRTNKLTGEDSATDLIRRSKPGQLNINFQDPTTGDTALHLAARYSGTHGGDSNIGFIGLLLRQPDIKASLDLTNGEGQNPLHLAVTYSTPEVVRLLLNHSDEDVVNKQICLSLSCEGDTPLHIAIRKRRGDEVEAIIGHLLDHQDIDTNRLVGVGVKVAPLHVAVDKGEEEIVKQLLDSAINRVDVNLETSYGATALHIAVEKSAQSIVELLVKDRDLKPNITDMHGDTALHIAVLKNDVRLVNAVLAANNIRVNTEDDNGNTALHLAAKNGRGEIVAVLLAAPDIDVSVENDRGETALSLARGHKEVLDKISESPRSQEVLHGSWVKRLCTSGMKEKKEEKKEEESQPNDNGEEASKTDSTPGALELLQEENPDINQKHHGNTALHCAIERFEYSAGGLIAELLARAELRVNEINRDGDTPLHLAVAKGDQKAVEELLRRSDIKINHPTNKENVLLRAIKASGRDAGIIEMLLDHNDINLNAKDSAGNSALHLSIINRNEALGTTLLAKGKINVNIKNGHGNTPLHEAVRLYQTNTIRKLLTHPNIRPNAPNNSGDTALLLAVQAESQALVQLLVEYSGVDVNATNSAGDTALHLAVIKKRSGIVTALLATRKIDVNIRGSSKKTPLLLAIDHNDPNTVSALLANPRIDPNLKETETRERNTPLHVAVKRHISTGQSHYRIILMLLGHAEVEPNTKNNLQESALMIAVKHENGTLVSNLLQYQSVDVDTADSRRKTALMYAVERGSLPIAHRLVARAANVNLQDDKKFTALHYAAHRGHVEVTRLLLNTSGIDITLKDKWRLTPQKRAQSRKHYDVVALFDQLRTRQERAANSVSILTELARGDSETGILTIVDRSHIKVNEVDSTNGYTALHYAAQRGYERVITALLEYDDINVNAPDSQTRTPLHIAAAGNQLRIVRALLGHSGINARAKTRNGYTALHYAAQLGYVNIARVLVEKDDALVNMQTSRLRTALHFASWLGHKSVFNLLLEQSNISLELKNDNGDTPLHHAAAYNRLYIANGLLEAGASTWVTNNQNKTARELAQANGYQQMVDLIDKHRN